MNYISLFSGIEAASVAWEPLGWHPVAFAEIEPFCCELLEKRFPNVPNLGDVSQVDWSGYEGTVDLVIGGSPCQAFSVAGRRGGLMDERGQLMLEYVRCIREVKPRWCIWENVPGVLSQDGGRAFGTLLRELEDCGFSLAWRVLDAQFFGVAQRRRRVFLVGHPMLGCAAGVLTDPDCLRGNSQTSRGKRQELAAGAERCAGGSYTLQVRCGCDGGGKGALVQDDVSATLTTANMQTLFQPRIGTEESRESGNCLNPWDSQTARIYSPDGVYPTLQARETGGMSREAICYNPNDVQSKRIYSPDGVAPTMQSGTGEGVNIQPIAPVDALPFNTTQVTSPQNGSNPQWGDPCHTLSAQDHPPAVCLGFKSEQGAKAHGIGAESEQSPTLTAYKPPAVCYALAGNMIGREAKNGPNGKGYYDDCSPTLTTADQHAVAFSWNQGFDVAPGNEVSPTLRAAHSGEPAVVCRADDTANAAIDEDLCGTLKCGGSAPVIANSYIVRRLMPIECERLQGFPDNWTQLGNTADAPRYRALGNSMAVPVIRYLGMMIEAVEAL